MLFQNLHALPLNLTPASAHYRSAWYTPSCPSRRTSRQSAHRTLAMASGQPSPPRVAVDELPRLMASDYQALQNPQQYAMTYVVYTDHAHIIVHRRQKNVHSPNIDNMCRYTNAVREFVKSAVLAYECGYTEDIVRQHLLAADKKGEQPDGQMDELCWRFISLVWVTCHFSPVSVRRWSTGQAVTEETLLYWSSFVKMIITGYFDKRMSWFPVERLLMERSFTTGASQKPELVAESARIVFTTLELIAPQFPSL